MDNKMEGVDLYIKEHTEAAKKIVSQLGQYEAHLFHVYEKEGQLDYSVINCNQFMVSDRMKELLLAGSHAMARSRIKEGANLVCAFLIADSYVAIRELRPEDRGKKSNEINTRSYLQGNVSEQEDRQEAVIVTVCFKDQAVITTYPYERIEGKGVVFNEKLRQSDKAGGHFAGLYPKNANN